MSFNKRADFFITGTDTGVGKTLVACALLQALGEAGYTAVGMKPIASGAEQRNGHWQNDDVANLAASSHADLVTELAQHKRINWLNPYCFPEAVAPHLAAQKQGKAIRLPPILECFKHLKTHADAVVVEGVGGFMVPINEQETTADLARYLQIPLVLVVGLRLGCINHALLTVEAIKAQGLHLAAWVANSVDTDMALQAENIASLQQRIAAPLLGVIPKLEQAQAHNAAAYLALEKLGEKTRQV
ncbi:MAG TPA: dethiobiotin synthase [Burkholderiaceae bacterium]|nr:dethiobiotin synthase [Burkholderiaceae bacterium]